MNADAGRVPDWDLEQLEVIMDDPASWQLVVAGPGTGKSAVACQRVAFLVDKGIAPSRILLISFTRTAVAELRDRIVSYAVEGDRARSVRISTIDSHAWSLRVGFDDEPLPKALGDGSYDLSIARVVELFRARQADLIDFMGRLEHVIIDESQDVVGLRADLIIEMLRCLADGCGVTILADPAQAIYGFTTDEEEPELGASSLLAMLDSCSPRKLVPRRLERIHRIHREELLAVFRRTRKEVEEASTPSGHVGRVQTTIRDTCGHDVGVTSFSDLPGFLMRESDGTTIVLFRRRADVLLASSYCSEAGVEHRLRMSGASVVVRPWLGWLLGEAPHPIISKEEFDKLWGRQAAREPAPFEGESRDECWTLLHRIAAGRMSGTLDLVQLRQLLSRSRPPVELCLPDLGTTGPILGTIHASKGREADTVVLVMPATAKLDESDENSSALFEEGRVYYVGATRARKMLIVATNTATPVGYLESRRVFRRLGPSRVQLEVGREGDVDRLAHLAWTNGSEVQAALASCAGRVVPIQASAREEFEYAFRLFLSLRTPEGVSRIVEAGQMSESFRRELGNIWTIVDAEQRLRPAPKIPHLYLVAVTTVGLTDEQRMAVRPPFSQSGFALAPVIKGFPAIQFFRRSRRKTR